MPCSARIISDMLTEILTVEKSDFLKSIFLSIIKFSVTRGVSILINLQYRVPGLFV